MRPSGADVELDGYAAARSGLAVTTRPDRARVRVTGRDPSGMLQGVLTNSVPSASSSSPKGVTRGAARYAAVLTPKGKMVADLRAVRGPAASDESLLLDVPAAALPGLLTHFGRYIPPRLARATDVSAQTAQLTVVGPGATAWLARDALGLRAETSDLDALAEDEWLWLDAGGAGVLVLRSGDLAASSFDVIGDRPTVDALERQARTAGAAQLSLEAIDVLRVEAGRPAWGAELDEETIPPEAGIDARAIDHGKGCYTGQEVIVRIRDRGHVNRRLRGLALGSGPLPPAGAELWAEGKERAVGTITRAVWSPSAVQGLALGYVRREVEVPGAVRVGSPDGPEARVVELREGWWVS